MALVCDATAADRAVLSYGSLNLQSGNVPGWETKVISPAIFRTLSVLPGSPCFSRAVSQDLDEYWHE